MFEEKPQRAPADTDTTPSRLYWCAPCTTRVAREADAIEVAGGFRHVFTNPAGETFEIGCFAAAPGCVVSGEPRSAHSWFAGYAWSYASCANCHAHLGWRFDGDGHFLGLIVSRLIGPI